MQKPLSDEQVAELARRARRGLKTSASGPTCVYAVSCEKAKARLPNCQSKKGRR